MRINAICFGFAPKAVNNSLPAVAVVAVAEAEWQRQWAAVVYWQNLWQWQRMAVAVWQWQWQRWQRQRALPAGSKKEQIQVSDIFIFDAWLIWTPPWTPGPPLGVQLWGVNFGGSNFTRELLWKGSKRGPIMGGQLRGVGNANIKQKYCNIYYYFALGRSIHVDFKLFSFSSPPSFPVVAHVFRLDRRR